jgi:hypothetical protein
MAFSEMDSREKTIIAVLGVVIVIALIGIGFLVAKLASDGTSSSEAVSVTGAAPGAGTPVATFTLVATASLEGLVQTTPATVGSQPVAVAQAKGIAPGLPAIMINEPLHGGHSYRLEVTAADGSKAKVSGSWSQSARNDAGAVEMDVSKPIEGKTPLSVDIKPPLSNPSSWSLSASVGPEDLLGDNPVLVITLWDVTGSE